MTNPLFLQDKTDNSLTLTKVAGIFYILIVGLGLSVIAAILEFLYKTRVDSRKQNVHTLYLIEFINYIYIG